jgi:hypothetical protein
VKALQTNGSGIMASKTLAAMASWQSWFFLWYFGTPGFD